MPLDLGMVPLCLYFIFFFTDPTPSCRNTVLLNRLAQHLIAHRLLEQQKVAALDVRIVFTFDTLEGVDYLSS